MTSWRQLRRQYADATQDALNAARAWSVDRVGPPPPPPAPPPHWETDGDDRACRRTREICMALWRGSVEQWNRITSPTDSVSEGSHC